MITAIVFGLLSAILWGAADFLSRKTSKSIGYYLTSSYVQLIGFIVSAPLAIFYATPIHALQLDLLSLNILLGVFTLVSFVFFYRGLNEGMISLVGPITGAMAPAAAVVLSVILLGQTIVTLDAYAIAGIITGVVLSGVNFSQLRNIFASTDLSATQSLETGFPEDCSEHTDVKDRIVKGLDSAFISAACAGVVFVGLGILTPRFGWLFPAIIIKGVAALVAFGCLFMLRRKLLIPDPETFLWLTLMGIMDLAGLVAFNLGVLTAGGYLPIVVTFSGLSGLVLLMLARVFYEERLTKIQSLGVFLVIIAALILLYYNRT